MANYYGKVRTNYFRVTDEEKYLEIRRGLQGTEDTIEFWDEDRNGVLCHGFGCNSLLTYQENFGTLESYADALTEQGKTWEGITIYCDCALSEAESAESRTIDDFPAENLSSWAVYHGDQREDGTVRLFVSEYPEDYCDSDMITFFQKMQTILPDGEAMIVVEVGSEKLRYLVGCATIVTKEQIQSVDLCDYALRKAKEMLGNPDFSTEMSY